MGIQTKKEMLKRRSRFFIVLIISLSVCLGFGITYIKEKQKLEKTQMEQLVMTKSNKLNEVLSRLLYKTQTLSVLVMQHNGEIENFEQVAATIIDDPAIKNIILAPDGVVSSVYPMEGNEKVIGLDYFSERDGNAEAVLAKETGQLILGGPFELVQGGAALVGRLPVYIGEEGEKEFWGIVSVTLAYPQALEGAGLDELERHGFAYRLWRISPDTKEKQVIASNSYNYKEGVRYVEHPVQICNAQWYFRIAPIREWYQYPEAWVCIFAALAISLLLAYLVMHTYDLHKMKEELEKLSMRDGLTGTLNRRGLFEKLEEEIVKKQSFVLCYVDINRFKEVNDSYGHNTGDKVLRKFADLLRREAVSRELIARIGGDEFIVVYQELEDKKKAQEYFSRVQKALESPLTIHGKPCLKCSCSVGMACYPAEGTSVDELIAMADEAMYIDKNNGKGLSREDTV